MSPRALGCGLLFLSASVARAELPPKQALSWVRAPGAEACIDVATLAQRVEALTGPVFVPPAQAERSFEASIAPFRGGFRVRIASAARDGSARGLREFSSAVRDCRALDAAIVFVLALTVEPDIDPAGFPADALHMFAQEVPPEETLLNELEEQPAQPRAPEPPAAPARPPEPPASPPPPQRDVERSPYALGAGAAGLYGTLPGLPFGAQAAVLLALRRAPSWLIAARGVPWSTPRRMNALASASFSAYELELSVCPLRGRSARLSAHGCLGPALAYLRSEGNSFERDRRAALWDPALSASALVSVWLVRRFGLFVQASGRVRLSDGKFVMRGGEQHVPVFTPSRVGVALGLGALFEI